MALFQGGPPKPNGVVHADFKAGRMTWDGKTVKPDKKKGRIVLFTSEDDQLMHFQWSDRESNDVTLDLIFFNDAYFQKITRCTTGDVYLLRFTSSDQKHFFWIQEPKAEGNAELIKKFNEAVNATIPDKNAKSAAPAVALTKDVALEKAKGLMSAAKAPQHYDKVFKDECVFTFDTPFSEDGLAVNLKTWQSYAAKDMVAIDCKKQGGQGSLYLLQKFKKVPKSGDVEMEKPDKLVIEDKFDTVKEYTLLVIDASGAKGEIPLPCADLPTVITQAVEAIQNHAGTKSVEDASRWEADQDLKVSKYCDTIVQLPATKKISPNPKDWKCEKSGDTQNLWLNLCDGSIGGGRKFWDGTGGSNGALDHFKEQHEKGNFYPLVVKLGTITPSGADVYSYAPDEDDMVKNPKLAEHLAHWGIDIMKMEKTDKSMAEMEVDLNMTYDWSKICESGEELVLVRGPGLVGLKNLGNSCYMNSVVQLLLTLPEAKARYFDADMTIRKGAPAEGPLDLVTQLAKLNNGLLGPRYAAPLKDGEDTDPKLEVAPQMFRSLIGKGHPEFSTGRQQDAGEFAQYLLEQVSRAEHKALGSRLPAGKAYSSYFEFNIEERLQDASGKVKYSTVASNMFGLPVKIDDAENLAEVTAWKAANPGESAAKKAKTEGEKEPEEPKPTIPFKQCLDRWAAPEDGISFRGSTASKYCRFKTMPRYLMISVQRYYVDEKWTPAKLDCSVPMPDTINVEQFRGKGLQPGEEEIPDDGSGAASAAVAAPAMEPDELMVAQLLSMGIGDNAAQRACLAVKNANAEVAAGWYFEHSEDPDINDPVPAPGAAGAVAADTSGADPDSVAMLVSMGFSDAHAAAALKACANSVERAADWLFSHADDLDGAVAALSSGGGGGGGGSSADDKEDGVGEYSLVGFVSHIGKNTACGHYVCHMKRGEGGSWMLFNDDKVAKSKSPPKDLGYIYLYRRNDAA